MKIELSDQELQFLLQILDQVSVRGIESKAIVLRLMAKVSGRVIVPEDGGAILSATERVVPGDQDGKEAA